MITERVFTEYLDVEKQILFKLKVDTDKTKKGRVFDSFNGLVRGVVLIINGQEKKVSFTDKDYFKTIFKKKLVVKLKCQPNNVKIS